MGDDSFLTGTHLEGLETQDMSFHLNERHITSQFPDGVETTAVHVFIRVILQQVTKSLDTQFLTEHLLPVGTYPWQELYVLL
jgi:hypothetical protein